MNGSGRSGRALPVVLLVGGLLLTGCGLVGTGDGGTATATVTVTPSDPASSQVTPSAGEPSDTPSPDDSEPQQTVDPNDPQGAAERFGVTLVDPGDAGMYLFDAVYFRSPSGRISCVMVDDAQDNSARCDIRDATFAPPRAPADCELDWGQAVYLTVDDAADFACVGDTVAQGDDGVVLEYGTGVVVGGIICMSRESGMTCRTTGPPDHGFTLSRARYTFD